MTGTRFGETLDEYCIHECGVMQEGEVVVGCDCHQNPPMTELPSLVFQSPASGLITVGVLSFFCSIIGCAGALRENRRYPPILNGDGAKYRRCIPIFRASAYVLPVL